MHRLQWSWHAGSRALCRSHLGSCLKSNVSGIVEVSGEVCEGARSVAGFESKQCQVPGTYSPSSISVGVGSAEHGWQGLFWEAHAMW